MSSMKTKNRILELIAGGETRTASELAGMTGISRQAVSRHLCNLVDSGQVIKEGATKGARFRLAKPGEKRPAGKRYTKKLLLNGLEEDRVFSEVALLLNLQAKVSSEAREIARYAFTEILNNAIEHSKSTECLVNFSLDGHDVRFVVRDYGVGVFNSIQSAFGLRDEDAAVAELLKGKATTMAEKHSGEGIFFTSKVADLFVLKSHRTTLAFGPGKENVRVEAGRFLKGTEARFTISARSRRKLEDVFREYAPGEFDYKFEKTRILVRIQAGECVSRSEAKRMVARLENFKEVELDFAGVTELGQAFADEVFRVFMRSNPGIIMGVRNMKPALRPMVKHVMDDDGRVIFVD
jgi:anti-sigma regulatory factor (Ser/Thr protein kinase)/biotin operon repressor